MMTIVLMMNLVIVMKQVVRMILIGTVLSVLNLVPETGFANDMFGQTYGTSQSPDLDFSLATIRYQTEAEWSVNSFSADFLLSHNTRSGYTMGIKYLDVHVDNELIEVTDHSQLWFGVQFSF